MKIAIIAAIAGFAPAGLVAQTAPQLTEVQEAALAVSAAPTNLTDSATVLVLRGNRYGVYRAGSNGVTCMVSRSRPLSIEPICYDPEASRTIMPMEKRRVELRLGGAGPDEIERLENASLASGEFTVPTATAMAYMLSAGQVLYANDTTLVGQWHPHLHVYKPYATRREQGLTGDPSTTAALMIDEGKANASMVVVLREFVEPRWGEN